VLFRSEGRGLDEVRERLEAHRAYLSASGEGRERRHRKLEQRIRHLVEESLLAEAWLRPDLARLLAERSREAADGSITPYEAATEILERTREGCPPPHKARSNHEP
jgi:LAO/AO transport system kinase